MISRLRSGRRLPLNALALALGISFFSDAALAGDEQYATAIRPPSNGRPRKTIFDRHNDKSAGTLGYGPPGAFPGFQGFGIGYQRGYGYGGWGLGVGAEGGFPFYSGPGYPHPDPTLRRYGTTRPFPYFGGPGGPTAHCPNFYGDPGPLVADKPVITIGDDRYDTGFGQYTGAIPYPEAVLAPFTTSAAAGAMTTEEGSPNPVGAGPNVPPSTGGNATMRIPDRSLGIDSEPVTDVEGKRGMKVAKVDPGSAAEKAGLHAGDVIHSTNGYVTTQPGNMEWIIANAATDGVLTITVRTASDGKVHTVTAKLP